LTLGTSFASTSAGVWCRLTDHCKEQGNDCEKKKDPPHLVSTKNAFRTFCACERFQAAVDDLVFIIHCVVGAAEVTLVGPTTHPLLRGTSGILGAARADELGTGGASETRVGNERCIALETVHLCYLLAMVF
jgi:hypothetical protein